MDFRTDEDRLTIARQLAGHDPQAAARVFGGLADDQPERGFGSATIWPPPPPAPPLPEVVMASRMLPGLTSSDPGFTPGE
jgi:hypothetical protein